jgi:ElaB/YqjD/DUF883 family membrane-anchored ribosome-binding protein
MNKNRRKALAELSADLQVLRDRLEELFDEEEEYRDNIPENLQGSERYEMAEASCDAMSMAMDSMDDAISYIDEAAN